MTYLFITWYFTNLVNYLFGSPPVASILVRLFWNLSFLGPHSLPGQAFRACFPFENETQHQLLSAYVITVATFPRARGKLHHGRARKLTKTTVSCT